MSGPPFYLVPGLPSDLTSSDVRGFRRLQVDQAETGFFEGREFRITRKIRLNVGEEIVYKNTLAVDIIIQRFEVSGTAGNFEVHVWTSDNVTEDVAFPNSIVPMPKNGSSEFREYNGARYATQMTVTHTGVVAAGTAITVTDDEQYVDYLELKVSDNSNFSSGVSGGTTSFRYTPSPVTFYTQITNIGETNACRGVINNEWEERPPSAQVNV